MEPESAAERLETFPPDESAEILLNITEKKRGAILEAMSNEISARVITEILNSGSSSTILCLVCFEDIKKHSIIITDIIGGEVASCNKA